MHHSRELTFFCLERSSQYIPNQQPDFEKWVSNIIEQTSLTSVQQDTVVVTNTSVTMTAETNPTSATDSTSATKPDSEPLGSPVALPMSNDEIPSMESQNNVPSTATSKTPSRHTLIATIMLFFHVVSSLFG